MKITLVLVFGCSVDERGDLFFYLLFHSKIYSTILRKPFSIDKIDFKMNQFLIFQEVEIDKLYFDETARNVYRLVEFDDCKCFS